MAETPYRQAFREQNDFRVLNFDCAVYSIMDRDRFLKEAGDLLRFVHPSGFDYVLKPHPDFGIVVLVTDELHKKRFPE